MGRLDRSSLRVAALQLVSEVRQSFYNSVAQVHYRLPPEQLSSNGNVRLANLGVVRRKRERVKRRVAPGFLEHDLGQLSNGEFVRVTNVHREISVRVKESKNALDFIFHETERTGLAPVATSTPEGTPSSP